MEGVETLGGLHNWRDFWASYNLVIRLGIAAVIFGSYGILTTKKRVLWSKTQSVFFVVTIIVVAYLAMSLVEIVKYPLQDIDVMLSIGAIYLLLPLIVVGVFSFLLGRYIARKNTEAEK